MVKTKSDDFDSTTLVKAEDHSALIERVKALEEKLGSNEKIAAAFCEAASTQIKINEAVVKTFTHCLEHDQVIKEKLTVVINKIDRDFTSKFLRRFGIWIGWLISLVITVLVTKYLGK